MPSSTDAHRHSSLALGVAVCLLWASAAVAQAPPSPSPPLPLPSPTTPSDDVAARLKTQDELIRQLAEQNRRLGEQLEAVSKRLDTIAAPKPPPPKEPPPEPETAPKPDENAKAPEPSRPVEDAPGPVAGSHAHSHSGERGLYDSLHRNEDYGLKSIFDSLHPEKSSGKHWYEKLTIRGYTQIRFGRGLDQDPAGAEPFLFGDRTINGNAENFSIRRARLILFGDVSDHLYLYFQPDFAVTPPGSAAPTFFAQLRDLYGDVYIDKTKIHRFRVGLSKIPYGFENMQSSQNRVPLDRSDALNSAVAPNERDLGVFYYWTPVAKQKLLKELVDGGLKGSGNYGVFGLGVYNGQGGSQIERNLNLHTVARLTWPFQLPRGQVVETSIQGYTGDYAVLGTKIRPLGRGSAITPAGTNDNKGIRDQRIAGSFIWYPQPFGLQAEWNVGEGPGLNDAQTAVDVRSLQGGYIMPMLKFDTERHGIFTPYARYQYYRGGYRSISNAPYGTHDQWNLGIEWQIRKEMELVGEYSFVDGINLNADDDEGAVSYRNFDGHVLRFQFQLNY